MTAPAPVVVDADGLDWMVHAACRDADWRAFFPELRGRRGMPDGVDVRPASVVAWRYCQGCPVVRLCHEMAERIPDTVGIWGGSLRSQKYRSGPITRLPLVPAAPKAERAS